MNPNSTMKMISAIQLTFGTAFPHRFVFRPESFFGREIDHRGEYRADEHPQELIPVKERHADPIRLGLVVERRPENDDELDHEEQIPPAPSVPFLLCIIHCRNSPLPCTTIGRP